MFKTFNPASVMAPSPVYSHGVEVPPNARWLYLAGQIGARTDGSVPGSIEEQTEIVWQNIHAILAEAGMSIRDVVKVTSFLTRAGDVAKFAPVRAKYLEGHRPASTLVLVAGLAKPEFLVEVEVVAAQAARAAAAARKPAPKTAGKAAGKTAKKTARSAPAKAKAAAKPRPASKRPAKKAKKRSR